MSDGTIIKEFLVGLGFAVDEPSFKKFDGALSSTDAAAKAVGSTVLGIAAAAEAMVVRFSSSMEKMYYASRRANASVANIRALRYGAEQVGVAGDDAQHALEGMARAMRLNPGLVGLLNGFGISTQNRDNVEVMNDFLDRLSSMPPFIAAQYAQLFGIDPDTLNMMLMGRDELIRKQKEINALWIAAGVDQDAAAEAGKKYMNTLRDIQARVEVVAARLAIDLLPAFQQMTKVVSEVLDDLARVNYQALDFDPKYITGFFDEQIKKLREASPEWENYLRLITDVIDRLKMKPGELVDDLISRYAPHGPRPGVPNTPDAQAAAAARDAAVSAAQARSGVRNLPLGLRNNNPGNLRSWGGVPVRNGFAAFTTPEEGLAAMAKNLRAYGKGGYNTIDKIINRWAPPSDNNDTESYIRAISSRMGLSRDQVLNLQDPKVMAALMAPMIQHEQGRQPYGTDMLLQAAQGATGGVTINQNNNISVTGVKDPAQAASAVDSNLRRSNSEVIRMVQGKIH